MARNHALALLSSAALMTMNLAAAQNSTSLAFLNYLNGSSFAGTNPNGDHQFTFRPFRNATQYVVPLTTTYSLGKFAGYSQVADATCTTGFRAAQQFLDGDFCAAAGINRTAYLAISCAANNVTSFNSTIIEYPVCVYTVSARVWWWW